MVGVLYVHFQDRRSLGRPFFQKTDEVTELFIGPPGIDLHIGAFIAHRPRDLRIVRVPCDRRPEPDALHYTVYLDPERVTFSACPGIDPFIVFVLIIHPDTTHLI